MSETKFLKECESIVKNLGEKKSEFLLEPSPKAILLVYSGLRPGESEDKTMGVFTQGIVTFGNGDILKDALVTAMKENRDLKHIIMMATMEALSD